jgi:glycosyltransferase involved in cell wall biosynthesis
VNIVMFTNTFTPHVGGVARSVEAFAAEYRRQGHRVLVVAPVFPDAPSGETDVVRIPAVQHFNGSDFSLPVPVPAALRSELDAFAPEILHSHHPFLLGHTALRVSAERDLPVVFTHHTMYERYTHYVPGDSPGLQRAAVELAVGYCNLCDAVIAPSDSVAALLVERQVTAPIRVVPTGVDIARFAAGDGADFRRRHGIPPAAFVVGHVGRLAPEKNVPLLAEAVAEMMEKRPGAWFVVAGEGPFAKPLCATFERRGIGNRLCRLGALPHDELVNTYASMDVFAFASLTETQGMVLTEAMAAGVPVLAVDAPGAREVVRDGENGRLLAQAGDAALSAALTAALGDIAGLSQARRRALSIAARQTAERFSIDRTAAWALELYRTVAGDRAPRLRELGALEVLRRRIAEEWRIWRNVAHAAESLREESD